MVAPGLAGLDTVLVLHDAARIGDPSRDLGHHRRQPGPRRRPGDRGRHRGDVRPRRGAATGTRRSSRRSAGDLLAMHAAACPPARGRPRCGRCRQPFDVVVTTGSGFPLDQNLYQSVKGMSAASQVVRPGGMIICAAECRDGFPDHGSYREVLASAPSPQALLDDIRGPYRDGAGSVAGADPGADPGAQPGGHAHLVPDRRRPGRRAPGADRTISPRPSQTRSRRPDRGARLCVLPEGPQTIPYVETSG